MTQSIALDPERGTNREAVWHCRTSTAPFFVQVAPATRRNIPAQRRRLMFVEPQPV